MEPFFILNAPRSGSTLLATMLGVHRRVVTLLESRWFFYLSGRLKRLSRSAPPDRRVKTLYEFLKTAERLDQLGTPPDKLWEIVGRFRESPDLILPALMAEFSGRTKPSADIWGEKSCLHSFHIEEIDRTFPNARYIHLVREPRANVYSIAKPSFDDFSNDWRIGAHVYFRFNRAIERDLARIAPERRMRLHYEDLVACPREELQRCCEFLGVEFDPAMLTHERSGRDLRGLGSVAAASALSGAFVDEWRRAFTPAQVCCIGRFTARLESSVRYPRSEEKTRRWTYAVPSALLSAEHLALRSIEIAVELIRGRPFVWSRLAFLRDGALRAIAARVRA